MILVILAAICLITVPLTGGRLGRLADLKLRCLWVAPLALALQVLIVTVAPDGHRSLHTAIHIVTYVLIGVFLWANLSLPGARVIAAGALANAIAIVANGGVMPASATAARIAGLTEHAGFNNSAQLAHAHLQWLGDIIPVPGPWPLQNVLSIGDILIFAGMLVLLHRTCGPARRPTRRRAVGPAVLRGVGRAGGRARGRLEPSIGGDQGAKSSGLS